MKVEVAYALPDEQFLQEVEVPDGATLKDAILQSGVLEKYPEIDLDSNKVGIFGKLHNLTDALQPNDRVEIYRPLICDPKEVRRQRAKKGKTSAKV